MGWDVIAAYAAMGFLIGVPALALAGVVVFWLLVYAILAVKILARMVRTPLDELRRRD
jgi:hypothetical protein